MKLYNVPDMIKIRILDANPETPPDAPKLKKGEILMFYWIDGVYSYCKKEDDTVCYLRADTEVEIWSKDEIRNI